MHNGPSPWSWEPRADVLCGAALVSITLDELRSVRHLTLEGLAARDDAWLERSVNPAPKINGHWAWFHVAEDEINHRGQIRWLRARLPSRRGGDHVS